MIMVTSFILPGFVLPTFIRFSVDKEKIGKDAAENFFGSSIMGFKSDLS